MTNPNPSTDPIRTAVRDGIRDALADPDTWSAVREAFAGYARSEAGGWTIGVARSALKWVLRGVLILGFCYYVGGLPMVAAYFKLGVK